MAIGITNFVNINIEKLQRVIDSGTRPTVVVYEVPRDAIEGLLTGDEGPGAGTFKDLILVGASSDYNTFYEQEGIATRRIKDDPKGKPVQQYARIFFRNGGVRLIFTARPLSALSDSEYKKENLQNIIWVQYNLDGMPKADYKDGNNPISLKNLIGTGIYSKLLIYRTGSDAGDLPKELENVDSSVIIKTSDIVGAEMTVAAYLSKMKVYDKVADYDFTEEFGVQEDLSNLLDDPINNKPVVINLRRNLEMQVGTNKYLNVGGNTLAGTSLVEQFVTIVLTQTLTDKVFDVLSTKLVGQRGLAAIRTAISAELDRYVNSGFLTTDKVWTSDDLIIDNPLNPGHPETIITKNTPLASGYYIHLFKLSLDRQAAYAFILLPTVKGIRYIKIDGRTM